MPYVHHFCLLGIAGKQFITIVHPTCPHLSASPFIICLCLHFNSRYQMSHLYLLLHASAEAAHQKPFYYKIQFSPEKTLKKNAQRLCQGRCLHRIGCCGQKPKVQVNCFGNGSDTWAMSSLQAACELHMLPQDFQGDSWQVRKSISPTRLRDVDAVLMHATAKAA